LFVLRILGLKGLGSKPLKALVTLKVEPHIIDEHMHVWGDIFVLINCLEELAPLP